MRHITSSIELHAPADFALSSLAMTLLERAPNAAATQVRLAVPLSPNPDATVVETSVDVDAKRERAKDGGTDVIAIKWTPHGDGPFPSFAGAIRCVPRTPTESTLTIAGEYRAPGDLAGAMFDAAVGATIATSTLHRLLAQFRDTLEADYRIRTAG